LKIVKCRGDGRKPAGVRVIGGEAARHDRAVFPPPLEA